MLWLVWLVLLVPIGAAVGSFLNVCIYRIPFEKSLIWPSSRCGHCLRPVRLYDNIPLLSYWLLRGRCRHCGTAFSMRYFLIELLTGLCFAGLFCLEIGLNIHQLPFLRDQEFFIRYGVIPLQGWVFFGYHATLLSLLIAATFTDIDHLEIPLSITLTGVVVGLTGSLLLPWPWPNRLGPEVWPTQGRGLMLAGNPRVPTTALYPWPVWNEMPAWLPLGSWRAGIATGLAGLVVGMLILRVIAFLFKHGRGKEGLGIGDADLMMMVGCFLGWQVVVVAFFVSVAPALILGVIQLIIHGDKPMPFGPSLALGTVVTWLGWRWIGPYLAPLFFDGPVVLFFAFVGVVLMFVAFWLLGVVRGREPPDQKQTV